MLNKRKIIVILIILMMTFNFVQAYADSLQDLKNKQKNINKELNQKQNEIKAIEKQTKNISEEIQELDKKMDKATIDLEAVEEELEKLEIAIEETLEELEEAEENIEEKQELFSSRLRVMYKNGNVGYLEVLLASGSIREFLSRKDMIQSIAKHDTELIQYMKEQRDIVESKKTELQAQKASVEVTRSRIESRRNDLAKVSRQKEDLMTRLKLDKVAFEKEYDELNNFAKKLESEIVKLQQNTGPYSGGKMGWPVKGYSRISSPYGYRIHPILNTKKLHTGLDIPAPTGTPILAAGDGVVIYSGNLGGYGKTIMIDHGGGIVTLYGHNSSLTVSVNKHVKRGELIAKAGSTGMSTGPHCHFEVRKNGAYVDPLPWLKGN